MDFTELSQFKHLVHLSLVVLKASDAQLKDFLVASLTALAREREGEVGELTRVAGELEERLTAAQEQLAARSSELELFRSEHSEQSASLGQRLTRDVAEEKERGAAAVQEVAARAEQERREAEARHVRSAQQLENRVASLDVQNRDLVEVRYRQEASLREARAKAAGQEEEVARLRQELAGARQERQGLERCGGEKERTVASLQARLAVVEQELEAKAAAGRQQGEAARVAEEARAAMARAVEEKTKLVERRERAVKTITEELIKANEIIGKLQAEVKAQQGKVRLRSSIAGEQEKVLEVKERELGEVRGRLEEQRRRAEQLVGEKQEAVTRLEESRGKVEELERLLETKENVMNWLNKQLAPGQGERGGGAARRGAGVVRGARPGARGKPRASPSDPLSNGTVTQVRIVYYLLGNS